MKKQRHLLSAAAFVFTGAFSTLRAAETPTPPFTSDWESLKKYEYPEWFRDAKLGIWAHWGPQSVPRQGDWFAKHLFIQGHRDYKYFVQHYGHPSEKGMEVIFPEWKAEKFDPAALIALYKKAGAKYFVSMGVHHDNFDLWDSKYNRWNAVKIGPHRDIVGEFAAASRKAGLKFGVSEHLGASYTWYQSARGADKNGPKAGVPYVGNKPELEDLYHPKAKPGDTKWYTTDETNWKDWRNRMDDLIAKYHPDLLYSDGGLPFGVYGRGMLASLYNDSIARHDGRNEAVYNCKSHHGNTESEQFVEGTCVHDIERGVAGGIAKYPWQTDTSIGDWFYDENWKCRRSDGTMGMYRDAGWVVRTLADIVSKNGNLLLNVVLRPDGSLDPEARKTVEDLGAWMAVNGEAIHGTRPWKVFGEGPATVKGGGFNEDFGLGAKDIRFTTKGGDLYVIVLGLPDDRKVSVTRLAAGAGRIDSVTLLGSDKAPEWKQTGNALEITFADLPASPLALVFKVRGLPAPVAK